MNHFYMNSDHAYHSNVITDSVWRATDRIFDRIERGNIVSVCVSSRKVKLTLSERYAIYKAHMDEIQQQVYKTAAENPDEILLNTYTHVFILPEAHASDSFLDTQGIPRYKGDPITKSEIDKLCELYHEKVAADINEAIINATN